MGKSYSTKSSARRGSRCHAQIRLSYRSTDLIDSFDGCRDTDLSSDIGRDIARSPLLSRENCITDGHKYREWRSNGQNLIKLIPVAPCDRLHTRATAFGLLLGST